MKLYAAALALVALPFLPPGRMALPTDPMPSATASTAALYNLYVTPPGRQEQIVFLELRNAAGQALKGDYLVTTVVNGPVLGAPIVYRSELNQLGNAMVKISANNIGNPNPLKSVLLFQLPDGLVTAPAFNLPPDPAMAIRSRLQTVR